MPQDPAAALSSLLRASSIEDHDEVLKAANAAIKADKSDVASQHTRIVALLKLDRFDDALRAIAEGGTMLSALCLLEQAYALYKTGKLDEATTVLQTAGIQKRGFSLLAAQVAYRAERFDDADSIYRRLLDTDAANEENDLNINIRAVTAQSEVLGFPLLSAPSAQDSDGFEICYNTACACITRGALDEASDLLQRAIKLCDASEDLTDEDKEAEMRPILAQQAFVYAKMGKLKEAVDLYQSLAKLESNEDPDLTVIAQNNLLALNPETENPYLIQRKFEDVMGAKNGSKLFSSQSNILRRNSFVIDLQAKKVAGVKSRTTTLLNQAAHPTTSADTSILSVLNAAASADQITGKHLIRKLHDLANKRANDVGMVLTIIQMQLDNGHTGAALSLLESFLHRLENAEENAKDVRFSPGLVGLAVALNRAQGRESTAKAELVKAASHWQNRPVGHVDSLLEEAGVELLKSSSRQDLQLAAGSFQRILNEKRGSEIAAAGLVAALAPFDPSAIRQHLEDLPPIDAQINEVDVNALLAAGVATAARATKATKRPADQESIEKPRKRSRKIRLPKDYVEGTKPDPERWLPLRDRSSYRPKGKKGKKKAGESTQGGIVKEEETLELVGGGGVKVEKAPPPSSKKKKKGKK
ncbi:hypothetical protein BGZ63DRAFT_416083 [Mariannaea sp. PMI_226]|nr:hypothetical protein BGZ63DRAFT_416083 [Mariannaea sp. PMI_226]